MWGSCQTVQLRLAIAREACPLDGLSAESHSMGKLNNATPVVQIRILRRDRKSRCASGLRDDTRAKCRPATRLRKTDLQIGPMRSSQQYAQICPAALCLSTLSAGDEVSCRTVLRRCIYVVYTVTCKWLLLERPPCEESRLLVITRPAHTIMSCLPKG